MTYMSRTDPEYREPLTRAELSARRREFRKVSGKVLHPPVRPADPDEIVDTRLTPDEVADGLARVADMRARIAVVAERAAAKGIAS